MLPTIGFFLLFTTIMGLVGGEVTKDTKEEEDITLECRFPLQLTGMQPAYFWWRTNRQGHDNVAIQGTPLDTAYRLDFKPEEGRYDLHITNVSYARDDGKFGCRLKMSGSGKDIHSQTYRVTVLTPPGPPKLGPSSNPTATEDKPINLTCTSSGGSPDPVIRWFKQGEKDPIESAIRSTSDYGVTSLLTVIPRKQDDGLLYRCVVWNRAMPAGAKLESSLSLNVNYYPRVEVGPENPLRIERDDTAVLQCNVDAKPRVTGIRWIKEGKFISNSFTHTIHRVAPEDTGKYRCSADNGLGQTKEGEIYLDVQYGPIVSVETGPGSSKHKEAEEGESIKINCNVSANPLPLIVEWFRDGRPEFRQNGLTLNLNRVTADSAGSYMCRASNNINPHSKKQITKVGNATVTLLVRHRPGKGSISPDHPVAAEGNGVILTCSAKPPGWPSPQFRWWRDTEESLRGGQITVLATGPKYSIPSVHLGSEGKYHCQATNELGHGDVATVTLTVNQAPRFQTKLQPHITRRVGDTDFSVSCAAQGKPKPHVKWFKDGNEISEEFFGVSTDESDGGTSVITVHSRLKFSGRERPGGNQLVPYDRGNYVCMFANEVKKIESTMHLRIEHEPITLHQYNKVASDLRETTEIICKVKAYPRPEFQWYFSSHVSPISSGSDGHYSINTTVNESGGDIYTSALVISNLRQSDYGEYICRVTNTLGSVRSQISVQAKGPPEKPESLTPKEIGHNYVLLEWKPGFNGGLLNTKYFVSYRRVLKSTSSKGDCYAQSKKSGNIENWREFDCQRNNPCNVTSLEQHQSYVFKVKAYNSKGQSEFSDESSAITQVDKVPSPQRVTFDPQTQKVSVNIAASCLNLIGMIELSSGMFDYNWRLVETMAFKPSGSTSRHDTTLRLTPRRAAKTSGRSLEQTNDDNLSPVDLDEIRLRMKFCLESNTDFCGDYTEAEIGSSYVRESSLIAIPTLVAVLVSCVICILLTILAIVFCKCRRTQVIAASTTKDYEMDSPGVHHSNIAQQPPPPYYPASGMENKALENSMDLALDDNHKNSVYGQSGYGYHTQPPITNNTEYFSGVNMGYLENSYSNSNNGGSVNSQDSLWQMKMAAQAANNPVNMAQNAPEHHHHINDRNNHYGVYDPLSQGGYGSVEDYAPYPHLLPSASPDYSRSNNPSRQDYSPEKPMRQHRVGDSSPYPHEVSGLPDPYMDHHMLMDHHPDDGLHQHQQQHQQNNYDPQNVESGFLTPNSRARRIREIIV